MRASTVAMLLSVNAVCGKEGLGPEGGLAVCLSGFKLTEHGRGLASQEMKDEDGTLITYQTCNSPTGPEGSQVSSIPTYCCEGGVCDPVMPALNAHCKVGSKQVCECDYCNGKPWELTPHGKGLASFGENIEKNPDHITYDWCDKNCVVGGVLDHWCEEGISRVCQCAAASASGDPFVVDQSGKRVQFFLPLHQEEMLVSCGGMKLFGTAFGTAIPGDEQQWFNKIRITLVEGDQDKETLSVSIAKNQTKAQDDEDITAPQSTSTLLQTINVMVEGHQMTKTGSIGTDDAALIAVWATNSQETVQLSYDSIVLQIKSAVAQKFTEKKEQVMYTHLDLRFVELDATKCTAGVLAEIWGVVTMSQRTAALLQPPKEHTEDKPKDQ